MPAVVGAVVGAVCLSWLLALSSALGHSGGVGPGQPLSPALPANDTGPADPCSSTDGFDAITLDEKGALLFFQGTSVRKGFSGRAEPLNASWPEIQGPLDAALRIHHPGHPDNDNVYLFQGNQVWAYAQGRLRDGFPRAIGEEFRGVPGDLDAAVECHPRDCLEPTVLFFKAPHVFSFDLKTKAVKQRLWAAPLSNCSAALRWLGRFYCFRGTHFWRFDPVLGEVASPAPKDARDYFMRCPGRGHGHEARQNATLRALLDPCSGQPFQAFTSDDAGHIYAFRGGHFFSVDSARDGRHAWPLNHTWRGLEGDVEAAFSWGDKLYLIQGSRVSIYRAGQGYSRVEGYPRALQEELGVASADAAFTCPHGHDAFVFQGSHVRRVDLQLSPRRPGPPLLTPHSRVDGALCTRQGLLLFRGPHFYHYPDVSSLAASSAPPPAQDIAAAFFGCPGGGGGPPRRPQQEPGPPRS